MKRILQKMKTDSLSGKHTGTRVPAYKSIEGTIEGLIFAVIGSI